jgi:hypothetical protein
MAKFLLKLEARKLRKKGISVKKIAQYLKVAKSSASIWTRDIVLTVEQLEKLRQSSLEGAEKGRIKSAFLQKEKWIKKMEEFKKLGIARVGKLTERELLIAGLSLYWGEGYKKGRRLQLCNSDPQIIKLTLFWLNKCFFINKSDIRCRVGINYIHLKRDNKIKNYWSKITGVPLSQFTKTSFKKVENKKIYNNFNNYYGTLAIEVSQPARYYGKIIGLIEGLRMYANVAQW